MPFIVIEGLDGSGKSTQVSRLVELLEAQGREYEFLHFPRYDSPVFGQLITRFLRGEFGSAECVDPYLVALLFAGDRADAAPILRRWLSQGKVVLTDRYVYSNVAFQCAKTADAAKAEELRRWIAATEFGYYGIPRPDASLFLDVPFSFTEQRLAARRVGSDRDYLAGAEDIHESSLDLQRRVRQIYLQCAAEDPTLHVVDCSDGNGRMLPPADVFAKLFSKLSDII